MAKKVFVYENEGELCVYPPVVVLTVNEDLELVNATEENVDWDVRANIFTGGPFVNKVPQGGKDTKRVPASATASAATYRVTGRSSKKKAKGNSDPVIIIDI